MLLNDLLKQRTELKEIEKTIIAQKEEVEKQIKIFMKERLWENYTDETTGTTVRITTEQRKSWDENQLQMFLTKEEYEKAQIFKTFENMSIMTTSDKERMNKFANIKKTKK